MVMGNQALSIDLQSRFTEDTTCQPRVIFNMWQEPEEDDTVDLFDLKQMWAAAKAGKSARTYKPYSSDIKMTEDTISFSIGFFVSTAPEGFEYELEPTLGTISRRKPVTLSRNTTAVFGLSNCVVLEGSIGGFSYSWQTPLIDKAGGTHPSLPITEVSGILFIDEPYFGVARVNYGLNADYYKLYVSLPTVNEDGNPIRYGNLDISINATHPEYEGSTVTIETLDIKIPEAVESALEMCEGNPGLVCYQCPSEWRLDIYYNTCDGSILDTHGVDPAEDDTWCLPADSGGRWGI